MQGGGHVRCSACTSRRGLAEVVRFPVPLAALIDDHSLFGADAPVIKRRSLF